MTSILDHNHDIVHNIREIYRLASPSNIRFLIEKHFVPSQSEKKHNAEISTPVSLVDEMLDKLPPDFWTTPKKVFEPCCGKGNFVLGIFDKFFEGLKGYEKDDSKRCEIIIKECLYYADLTTLNVFITTEILKNHIRLRSGKEWGEEIITNSNVGDTLRLDTKERWGIERFDAVIGNPPYSTDPSKQDTMPIYNIFVERLIVHKILLFVIPSRWFIGGKGLESFRRMMMKRKDIRIIRHEDDATKWFGKNIEIKGGVNYFLKDELYQGICKFNNVNYKLSRYNHIIKPEHHKLIESVILTKKYKMMLSEIYITSGFFKYRTNDKRLKSDGNIKCFVSKKKSIDRSQYIDTYLFNDNNLFWKVITPRASHKAFSGFGEIFIGKPMEIHTDSYISFRVNDKQEALSLMSYLKTKFVNKLLSIRKISQDISKNTCEWIPLLPLDREWTDESVCRYLKIESDLYLKC